jgi:ABC-type glycerol-3-phosphate transport system substrate-binding protein
MKELHDLGAYPGNITTLGYTDAMEIFKAGNAAMVTTGSWELGALNDPEQTPIHDSIVFNFGPSFPDSKYEQRLGTIKEIAWGLYISKRLEKNKASYDMAVKYLKFTGSPEGARIVFDEGGDFPATKYPGDISKKPPLTQSLYAMIANDAKPLYEIERTQDPAFGDVYWNTVTGVISGVLSPQEACKMIDDWNSTQ